MKRSVLFLALLSAFGCAAEPQAMKLDARSSTIDLPAPAPPSGSFVSREAFESVRDNLAPRTLWLYNSADTTWYVVTFARQQGEDIWGIAPTERAFRREEQ
jgi:hypothetical protein